MKRHSNTFTIRKQLEDSITSIPRANKSKFSNDLLTLIELAHEDNYEDYHFVK